MKPRPDKQLILDSIVAIAKGASRPPSRSEFLSLSGISEHFVLEFFPSWNDAVKAAGLVPWTINDRLEDSALLEDWALAVRRKGKLPSRRAYRHLGQYDHRTFERRFGPWSTLPEVFRNFAKDKPECADVLALLPPAIKVEVPASNPARSEPVGARFSASPAPKPSPRREPKPGTVILPAPLLTGSEAKDPGVIATQLKTVQTPTIPASSNDDRAPNRQSPSPPAPAKALRDKVRYPPLHGRPTYGGTLDFRGLRHEPVNEQGVVLLFGLVAKELGYIVESVQSGFPDCEAKRQIAPQRWQRVHIEFEFESRNFRDHGHPLTGCDVIVCWRHNWPDCPPQIEILELSSIIKSLPTSDD